MTKCPCVQTYYQTATQHLCLIVKCINYVSFNFYVSRPELVVEERPIFQCRNCNITERYDCFSDHVPFNRNIRTKVDYYLARDPFSPRNKRQFIILGSVCSVCDKDVCVKPECSLFYSKFFCTDCARKHILNFPPCIQEKIKAVKRI